MRNAQSQRPLASRLRLLTMAVVGALGLGACGGSGGSNSPASPVGSSSGQFAQKCSANNPFRVDSEAGPNPEVASLSVEKLWVRAYIDEAYLWYDKVPNINASLAAYSNEGDVYGSLDNYFSALTVDALVEDKFSFTFPTKQWKDLSISGISVGYGIEFSIISRTVPRVLRIAYVEPGSVAAAAGLRRGDQVVAVNGFDINDPTQVGVDAINAGVFPSRAGSNSFTFSRSGGLLATVSLTAGNVTSTPVPTTLVQNVGGARIGYLVFNDHIRTAEQQLVNSFNTFAAQGINDLVIDLRYNSGGFLFLASQVAYMVAGPARTANKTFERLQYNSKRAAESNSQNSLTPFFNVTTGSQALPSLNLSRVYVLAGPNTCSASEAIVNGLRGVGVQVNIIGGTTCGKPHGFTARDNCGVSYFPIEFKGVNDVGFGDYEAGFAPTCAAADDFSRQLGDPNEGLFAAAMFHRANGTCSPAFAQGKQAQPEGRLMRGPERSNKIHVDFSSLRR